MYVIILFMNNDRSLLLNIYAFYFFFSSCHLVFPIQFLLGLLFLMLNKKLSTFTIKDNVNSGFLIDTFKKDTSVPSILKFYCE